MGIPPGVAALCELPARRLRQAAFACGSLLTGRKSTVASHLHKLALRRAQTAGRCRVVSVDLGVKNIGSCRLLAPAVESIGGRAMVEDWQLASLPPSLEFVYPEFSSAAIDVVSELLAGRAVDVVLVERQRSRSAGSPMIANSILRVNVMEGMVFTALQTLYPSMHVESVNPKHVVEFWRAAYGTEPTATAEKRTAAQSYRESKRIRKAILDQWEAHPSLSPLDFSQLAPRDREGKRDDMDDALVQALTWSHWRTNSLQLLQNIEKGEDPLKGLYSV